MLFLAQHTVNHEISEQTHSFKTQKDENERLLKEQIKISNSVYKNSAVLTERECNEALLFCFYKYPCVQVQCGFTNLLM